MKYHPRHNRRCANRVFYMLLMCLVSLGSGTLLAQGQVPPLTFPTTGQPGSLPFGTGVPGQFAPSGQVGAGVFDPYASSRTIATPFNFPNMAPAGQPNPTGNMFGQGTFWGQPPANPYGIPQPPVTAPTWPGATANPYGANPYGAGGGPVFNGAPAGGNPFGPGSPYYNPGQQPSLYPGGFNWGNSGYGAQKVFQDFGFRYSWIAGEEDPSDLDISDAEVHGSVVFPGFLNPATPLYVTPGFVFHFWDGPQGIPAELPAQAYSAYLDFAWQSPAEQIVGADLDFRVGVYSDFHTFTTDSIRFQGQGLGLVRLTPAVTLKGGVRYIDRAHLKLLPAAGILWQPNPQVKLDIFFPQPKLAMYLSTVGTAQVWGYIAGEYGGGNWTIKQGGVTERVDINDIRVVGGIEWFGSQGVNGFLEGGYVFNREVYYVVVPANRFEPSDSFVVRGGLSF